MGDGLDRVVYVCFAMLGVPLGSANLTGVCGGKGGGKWIRGLLWRLQHYVTTRNVHLCVCERAVALSLC